MKKFILSLAAFVAFATTAMAQVDFNDPRWAPWGDTAEEREKNMLSNTFFREALESKNFDDATKHFNDLITNAPSASVAIYQRGAMLYKNKINRAQSLAEKSGYVDTLIMVYDLRLEHFADDPKQGKVYILDLKARDYATYKMRDREGMREAFVEALKASEATPNGMKPDLAYMYFNNLIQDFQMDEVMAEEVLEAYDWLSPFFDSLIGEDHKYSDGFQNIFSSSDAASCENLEVLFKAKYEADPNNAELLARMVSILGRRNCTSSPFYVVVAEKLYSIAPTSTAAMGLAAIFQNSGEYAKASQYLTDALAVEVDVEEREALLRRLALIQMAAGNMTEAASYANQALAISDDDESDDGVALFVLAQAYSATAGACTGFDAQAIYWVAYDTINRALSSFSPSEQGYVAPAEAMRSSFLSHFPTAEEAFFQELSEGATYRVNCGLVHGVNTRVRVRK